MIYVLVELGHDATAAYSVAIGRTKDPDLRAVLARFRAQHMKHTYGLREQLASLRTEPPTRFDMWPILQHGAKEIVGLNTDREVLAALQHNERMMYAVYSLTLKDHRVPAEILSMLKLMLADQQRHDTWLGQQIACAPSRARVLGTAKLHSHTSRRH
jgi:rubrerythrin